MMEVIAEHAWDMVGGDDMAFGMIHPLSGMCDGPPNSPASVG